MITHTKHNFFNLVLICDYYFVKKMISYFLNIRHMTKVIYMIYLNIFNLYYIFIHFYNKCGCVKTFFLLKHFFN